METKEIEGYDEPIVCMSWDDVQTRLNLYDLPDAKLCPANVGAMAACLMLRKAECITEATELELLTCVTTRVLVDVLESPEQEAEFQRQFPHTKIVSLFDRTGSDSNKGILVMPWEEEPRSLKPRLTTSPGFTPAEWVTFELSQQLAESLADLEPADANVDVIADHVGLIQTCLMAAPTARIMQGRGV